MVERGLADDDETDESLGELRVVLMRMIYHLIWIDPLIRVWGR